MNNNNMNNINNNNNVNSDKDDIDIDSNNKDNSIDTTNNNNIDNNNIDSNEDHDNSNDNIYNKDGNNNNNNINSDIDNSYNIDNDRSSSIDNNIDDVNNSNNSNSNNNNNNNNNNEIICAAHWPPFPIDPTAPNRGLRLHKRDELSELFDALKEIGNMLSNMNLVDPMCESPENVRTPSLQQQAELESLPSPIPSPMPSPIRHANHSTTDISNINVSSLIKTNNNNNNNNNNNKTSGLKLSQSFTDPNINSQQLKWIEGLKLSVNTTLQKTRNRVQERRRASILELTQDKPKIDINQIEFDMEKLYTQQDIENAVEILENVCGRLQEVEKQLELSIKTYIERQINDCQPIIQGLKSRLNALDKLLVKTKEDEAKAREIFDAISHEALKAKNTVRTANELKFGNVDAGALSNNLEEVREQRLVAFGELENVLNRRNKLQLASICIKSLLKQIDKEIDHRDYAEILELVDSHEFVYMLSDEDIEWYRTSIRSLASHRKCQRLGEVKMLDVKLIIAGVRDRIVHTVASYW